MDTAGELTVALTNCTSKQRDAHYREHILGRGKEGDEIITCPRVSEKRNTLSLTVCQ